MDLETLSALSIPSTSKIVMLVIDGLGGLPFEDGGMTELERAKTPNLDALARRSICGMIDLVAPGITPGSGPGHLALFGYDPLKYQIGRGALEALGIDLELDPRDVAARGNFCTIDDKGLITDRRAGRISTDKCRELCLLLEKIELEGSEVFVRPVKEHRFVVVFRGEDLRDELTESDPQQIGHLPLRVEPRIPEASRTARIVNSFIDQGRSLLAGSRPANMVLLRGFSRHPCLPTLPRLFGIRAAAIATYPMYRGLAKLVGMEALPTGPDISHEFQALKENYQDYDFFYLHIKRTDSLGEDGDFEGKVKGIEEVDEYIPSLIALNPEVVVVTGDHSTPAALKSHSWHPVPLLIYSKWCRPDSVKEFSEKACTAGALGRLPAVQILPLALANALRLTKFGA